MAEALSVAALLVLATVAIGLARVLGGPTRIDRLMAVQLLGSGGTAALLLIAVATDTASVVDVALTLALLAAFASAAFATTAKQVFAEKRKAEGKR